MKINFKLIRRVGLFLTTGISATYVVAKNPRAGDIEELQLKIGDEVVPVPPKILNLIDEVSQDLKLSKHVKAIPFKLADNAEVIPYMSKNNQLSNCLDIFGMKSYIGIPEYFTYDLDNNENFKVVIDGKEIPQNAPEYESLKQSMCLSREAKKFAIAYEIYESQHSPIMRYCILPTLVVLNTYFMSYIMEKSLPIRKASEQHIFIYSTVPIMCFIVLEMFDCGKEYNSSLYAANLGKSYIQGGLEYYEKLIQRNKILKSLNVNAPYTENGDITSKFRGNHFSLYKRITCLKEINEGKKGPLYKRLFMIF